MQTLPTTFRDHGFDYTQLARDGDVAILKQSKPKMKTIAYEVVLVQNRPDRVAFGDFVSAREAMPAASAWGTKGWTFVDLEQAEVRFWQLVTLKEMFPRSQYSTPELTGDRTLSAY